MVKKKYPEASVKYGQYKDLVIELTGYKNMIETNTSLSLSTGYIGSDVSGVYYDKFAEKEQEWRRQVNQIIADFSDFQTDLEACISEAELQASIWFIRINQTEEEG